MSSEIADIHGPLVTAGTLFTALIGFYKFLVSKKTIPSPEKGRIVSKMIDYAFILALTMLIIGFVIKPVTEGLSPSTTQTTTVENTGSTIGIQSIGDNNAISPINDQIKPRGK